ncbi:MAG: DUF2062 domain-containing protein [Wenzhouxiangellaceae bacterium]|nr:DUF2062 domain-containing protein [Wenzhouxiangellaceae bacterium]
MRWLRLKFLQGSRQQRGRIRQWLSEHPRVSGVLERSGCLNVDEFTLARGVSVGIFVGLTPTVGIQTIMMLAASMIFRANFPAAMVVSFVSNPLTMAPLYFGFSQLGQRLLPLLPVPQAPITTVADEIAVETLELLLGSLVIAAPSGLAAYVVFLWLWRKLGLRLPRSGDKTSDKTSAAKPDKNE